MGDKMSIQQQQQSAPTQPVANREPPDRRYIQPVTVSYAAAWMHFLIVLCLLVAWYFPMRVLIGHWLWPKAEVGPRTSHAFVALAYEGVSKRTNEVSTALFVEHLDTLRSRGYVPIGLEDVRQLVFEGKPVPEKAVLLTFDHGRKTSYFAVDSILRRAGWKAVMFLWTRPIVEKDSAALLWPYIRIMSRSGTWELGAQSHNGFASVPASPRGYLGHFMTTAQWMAEQNRFESPTEFANRLAYDHETCIQTVEKKIGIKPSAYAYPYGDFGQFESRAAFARRINLQLANKYYGLGFLTGNLAANTRYSDPKRLNRVRVKPEWSGEDLAAFLDRSWPIQESAASTNTSRMASAWIVDWGGMREEQNKLTLYAPEQITGAKMWLAGSDLTKDFFARVSFSDLIGQMGIYARAAADEESYVYLGLDAKGSVYLRQTRFGKDDSRFDEEQMRDMMVWLRQKHVSLERFTLASSRIYVDPTREHALDIYARGPLLFARLDGKPIFNDRVMLRGDMKPGMMGLSVWHPDKGRAKVTISEITLHTQEQEVAAWNSALQMDPAIFRWVHHHAYHLTDISPPWINFSSSGQMVKSSWDPNSYRMLAQMYQLRLMPRVVINDERALARLAPSQICDRLAEAKAQGVYVAMDEMQDPSSQRVTSWLQQCANDLRSKGMSLLVRLPSAMEKPALVRSILAMSPQIQVVAAPSSPLRATDAKGRTNVPTTQLEQVPEPEQDKDMPVFYELNSATEMQGDPTPAFQASRLQQDGQAAFLDADYNKAINLWKKWTAIEPNNPRAPMLIGDAFMRLGDFKQALTNYDASLTQDPGQIRLALRRAGLLDSIGRAEDAMTSLNMYARLFPENTEIMLAQAEWLRRHDRGGEAIPIVKHVTQVDTNSFEANALMLRLPIASADYRTHMETLLRIGEKPEYHFELGQAIWKYDLLSMPGSHALVRAVRRIANQSKEARVTTLYERLMPRTSQVTDVFAGGRISDAWWLDGGTFTADSGKVLLRSDDSHTEATMRLLGSEHFRDAYAEATFQRKNGAFWLYAHRTGEHMARYGVDETGKLFLQLWRGSRIVDQRTKAWTEPKGMVRLRLEVRGDGVMGYVDGQPAFTSPLELPDDFELGWVGMAAFAADRGKAQAILERACAGPLAPRILQLSAFKDEATIDANLAVVRPEINYITDISPPWFRTGADGSWTPMLGKEEQLLRLFARYYRVRLMPTVMVDAANALRAEDLLNYAAKFKLDGFVLLCQTLPDATWFDNMERSLGAANLKVLVASMDVSKDTGHMRGLASGTDLLSTSPEATQEAVLQKWGRDGSHKPLTELPPAKPAILLF
jgi:tetratricopeptide (TPR) repeat protein/peptidoglycan/xylan/chitin deacetylase (PgdA/CDA1 family)